MPYRKQKTGTISSLNIGKKNHNKIMHQVSISLGRGIVKNISICSEGHVSNLSNILQEFGFSKNDLVDISMTYEELCEIHSLAKALHESVKKLKFD